MKRAVDFMRDACVRTITMDYMVFLLMILIWSMGYCIDGQISCRLKIELGTLGPPVIKVVLSAYSSTCQEQLGTKLTSGKNYWGKYGPLLLFAIRVDKHFAFIFLITWFSQNTEGYDISTLTNFQVINPTRSGVTGDYSRNLLIFFEK